MLNPYFPPAVYPAVSAARLNAIVAAVRAYLQANAAKSEIAPADILALAPEFAQTPGTLKAVRDSLGLS